MDPRVRGDDKRKSRGLPCNHRLARALLIIAPERRKTAQALDDFRKYLDYFLNLLICILSAERKSNRPFGKLHGDADRFQHMGWFGLARGAGAPRRDANALHIQSD